MEPIVTYIVSAFFGYYISTDMYNFVKFRNEFEEIKLRLDTIHHNTSKRTC